MTHGGRRRFLGGLLAAGLSPQLTWADAGNPAYLAAAREADGGFALFGLSPQGQDLFRIPLPGRGHAAAAHPTYPEAVAFARRPGRFALVIDCARGELIRRLDTPEGRHFYGHGVFLDDDTLCCTENDIESGEGRISLWSRRNGYRRIGDIPSGGIGPHDLKRLPDGKTLVVANGGIRTHPDSGREKLNLDTMRPNLSYLTVGVGVMEQVELDPALHKNSIRHLDLRRDGMVGFAMQWQGEQHESAPLLGLHRRGAAPVFPTFPDQDLMRMKGYAGSISFSGPGDAVAITSPRGGVLLVHRNEGASFSWSRRDVCGVAAAATGFVTTDGLGGLFRISGQTPHTLTLANRAWDNHLIRI